MKQNIVIETKDGKVKLQFDKCQNCKDYNFCYLENGVHHKSTPRGLSEECLTN